MQRISLRTRRSILIALTLMLACGTLWAAKPSPPLPPPPPPPSDPFTTYEWRADLGGWLDKTNNLVWGYTCYDLVNHGGNHSNAVAWAETYPDLLMGGAEWREFQADDYFAEAAYYYSIGNVELGDHKFAIAEAFLAGAQACLDAAAVAAQYDNWRLPTLSEGTDAAAKGLFTYGPDGFNDYWGAPDMIGRADKGVSWWSATKSGKKNAWWWNGAGGTATAPVTSSIDFISVRTHTP